MKIIHKFLESLCATYLEHRDRVTNPPSARTSPFTSVELYMWEKCVAEFDQSIDLFNRAAVNKGDAIKVSFKGREDLH